MVSKEKERHPKRWGRRDERGKICKSVEGGKKIEQIGRGGLKGRVGGKKGVVRMGGESKMNGGRVRGLGKLSHLVSGWTWQTRC